ncbi:MAG: efflux RND transporter permease subunit [Bacteroidales bacterium]|nr:efflux RND transporter permease subunit [Bacteroidales bacterium]
MKLPRLATGNYQFTLMAFILLTIWGVNAFINMPKTENPTIYVPGAGIVMIYPGADPVDLEELIAIPIEEAINELEDIKKINTNLKDGIAYVGVEFTYGTDAQEKYDEVVQEINSIKTDLPDDIHSISINQWTSTDVAILQLALVSETAEFRVMKDKGEKLKKQIEKVSGVKSVDLVAAPRQEVRISLDMEQMAQMNISASQVADAIRSNSAIIPGGAMDLGDKNYSIKTSGSFKNLEEIRRTVVHSYEGRLIYLENIANVHFDYEDVSYKARFNGKRSIFMKVLQKEGYNIFDIRENIDPILQDFRQEELDDVRLEVVFDQATIVDDRINGFLGNLLQGIILVGIVILLALGFRSSVIVIVAIPLSIIVGLGIVDLSGFGLQQISIAGLVVALGLLVDNSIVMVENINRFIANGYSRKEAAVKAASQVGWAISSATLTTVLAFVPVIMMPDKAGDFIRSLPLTIIATLAVSLLIALSLSPLIASKVLKPYQKIKKKKKKEQNTDSRENRFQQWLKGFIEGPYRSTLRYTLNHRALVLIVAVVLLGISGFVFRYVGLSFFPKSETPQLMIRVLMPEGTNLDETDEVAQYVESVLDTVPDIEKYATNVGHGNPRIYYNVFPRRYAKNFADFYVHLHEYEYPEFDHLVERLRKTFADYPGARINVTEFEQGPPSDSPIMIYVTGEKVEILKDLGREVENYLEAQPGAINIDNQMSKSKSNLHFRINKIKAGMLGVPVARIDKTIRTALNGVVVSKYRDDEGEEYDLILRLPVDGEVTLQDIDKIYVTSMFNRQIPLRQLATYEFSQAPSVITRYNLDRSALITAETGKGYSLDEVLGPVMEKLENKDFPKGYDYKISGELENRQESFGGMGRAMVIAIIAIFAVLVLQFRSFSQPLIIFVAVPFAMIGMVWALLISGYTFSFTAFIGLISLIGIVINNSIILVDYTNQLLREGNKMKKAIRKAGETRFTPIILTTLTTIGGLLPLTIRGGTLWAPLGWTVIGGLLVSTFLTLIVVPVLYHMFTRRAA